MTSIETRPYSTPDQNAVRAYVMLKSPAISLADLPEHWEPGVDLNFKFSAELDEQFWEQSMLHPDEEVSLVGTIYCASIRKKWVGENTFSGSGPRKTASLEILVPGALVAAELRYDVWVVGEGVTNGYGGGMHASRHPKAKLWELRGQRPIPLEQLDGVFPTSAVSFNRTGRLGVPWAIELTEDAEPGDMIDQCLRMYVNTDLPIHEKILNDKAAPDIYSQMEADICFIVIQRLAEWLDLNQVEILEGLMRRDPGSLGAMGLAGCEKAGLSYLGALQMAKDEPLELMMSFRESFRIFQEEQS